MNLNIGTQSQYSTTQWFSDFEESYEKYGFHFRVVDHLNSERIRFSSLDYRWQDEHRWEIDMSQKVFQRWRVGYRWLGYDFKDGKTVQNYQNQIMKHGFTIGSTDWDFDAGSIKDQWLNHSDSGFFWKIAKESTTNIPLSFLFEHEILQDKFNKTHEIFAKKTFSTKDVAYRVNFKVNGHQRDYYLSESNDIERRIQNDMKAGHYLDYPLLAGSASWESKIHYSFISFGNTGEDPTRKKEDVSVLNRIAVKKQIHNLSTANYFEWDSSKRNMDVSDKNQHGTIGVADYDQRVFIWHSDIFWKTNAYDTLFIAPRIYRLWFDTPSVENDDDRDELRYEVNISHKHWTASRFFSNVEVTFINNHLSYLFNSRSGENRRERFYKLEFQLGMQTENTNFSTRCSIWSNMFLYDFESLLPGWQSMIIRGAVGKLHEEFKITSHVYLVLREIFRINERGLFRLNPRGEQPIVSIFEPSGEIILKWNAAYWHLGVGASVYNRKYHYFENADMDEHTDRLSWGPILFFSKRKNGEEIMSLEYNLLNTSVAKATPYQTFAGHLRVNWSL